MVKFTEWRCTMVLVVTTVFAVFLQPENTSVWQYLGSVVLYYAITMWGMSAVYHRWYSHGSYDAPSWFVNIGTALFMTAGAGAPRSWATIHTGHHMYADTEKDPHSPRHKTLRTFTHSPKILINKEVILHLNDRVKTNNQKLLTKYYNVILASWVGFLYLLGYEFLYFLFLVPISLVCISSLISNSVPHLVKWSKPHVNQSGFANNMPKWWGLLLAEGFHNTHHTKPWLWEQREDGKGFDIAATLIRWFKYPDRG